MPPPSATNRPHQSRRTLLIGLGLSLVILLGGFWGCGTVHLEVPPGRSVTLLDQDEPTSVRVERTVWYALWGGKPLSDNSIAATIQEHNLTQVRVTVVQNFWDTVINAVTCYFSFVRRTVIVEGNQ